VDGMRGRAVLLSALPALLDSASINWQFSGIGGVNTWETPGINWQFSGIGGVNTWETPGINWQFSGIGGVNTPTVRL